MWWFCKCCFRLRESIGFGKYKLQKPEIVTTIISLSVPSLYFGVPLLSRQAPLLACSRVGGFEGPFLLRNFG